MTSTSESELPLIGQPFAVELANTHYVNGHADRDFLGDAEWIATWFAAVDGDLAVPRPLPEPPAAALRAVRDATRQLLTELTDGRRPLSAQAAAVLHDASRSACAHLALDVAGEAPRWDLHVDGPEADVLVATVAARSILFLGGEDARSVRRCARAACPLLFVQRHRARRFCSEYCSHSVRQARYYRAHRP